MRIKILELIIIILTIVSFVSCKSVDTESDKLIVDNENLQNSLANHKTIIDSLTHTDANLFSTALDLEKESTAKALTLYRQLANQDGKSYFKTEAKNKVHYFESLRFLDFLKISNADQTDVAAYHKTYSIDNIDSLMTFISSNGLEIYDANEIGNENMSYTKGELKEQLITKTGKAFQTLTQLSYIYSLPYPQYSDTYYAVSTDFVGIYIRMQSHYRLSFLFVGNDKPYKLRKIESYHIDDL